MNTTTGTHTHRFNDEATCERCGATYTEVVAARQSTEAPKDDRLTKAQQELKAAAAQNDATERAARRRTYYEHTGR